MAENNPDIPVFLEKDKQPEASLNNPGEIVELTEILQTEDSNFQKGETILDNNLDQADSNAFTQEKSLQEKSLHQESLFDDTADILEDDGIDLTILKLESIEEQIKQLSDEFSSKLKYDAHKEKIIDHLHQELQQYKNNIIKKQSLNIIMDLIKVIDGIRKFSAYYKSKDLSSVAPKKLLDFIEGISSDIEDIFSLQDVNPFICDNDSFDPSRQKIIQKIITKDKAQDKIVARTLYPGYECEGKVIRQEMVQILIWKNS
ncbi:MAG: nucleotide exchange factor GrpE [Desulfosarcina sp.]|nr:nucleotide exchange factor GrpE [Desulfobacterales bacterium]